jgi:hypothetical protein
MNYRHFLEEAAMVQLREGRDGLRLVGVGLVVPYAPGSNSHDWEAVFSRVNLDEDHVRFELVAALHNRPEGRSCSSRLS